MKPVNPDRLTIQTKFPAGALKEATHRLSTHYPTLCAQNRLTVMQKFSVLGITSIIVLTLIVAPTYIAASFVWAFIIICIGTNLLRIILFFFAFTKRDISPFPPLPAILPMVTILVPVYKEANCLASLVTALRQLDYPIEKLDIKILVEMDDRATLSAALEYAADAPFDILVVPHTHPKTKPKACNYGLWHAKGVYTVIYDAEDRPEHDQVLKAIQKFQHSGAKLACLQARLNYYNHDRSILTRLFTLEYTLLFDYFLPGLSRLGAPLPLGGTSNFFKTSILKQIGGWDPYNVTEDADLGLRLAAAGYKSDVLDSTTWEEATATAWPWIRQRSRWLKGFLQTWLVHLRFKPTAFREASPLQGLTHHLFIGAGFYAAVTNPLICLILAGPIFNWYELTAIGLHDPIASIVLIILVGCSLIQILMLIVAPIKRGWPYLGVYTAFIPFYWLLQSIAGYKALWQFCTRPFYWEKTVHPEAAQSGTVKSGATHPRRAATENKVSCE